MKGETTLAAVLIVVILSGALVYLTEEGIVDLSILENSPVENAATPGENALPGDEHEVTTSENAEIWGENASPGSGHKETTAENAMTPGENASTGDEPSYWDNHDLNAIPGLENATVEDLPTVEKVENLMWEWRKENMLGFLLDRSGPREEIVGILEKYEFIEWHTDGDNRIVVDTPGIWLKRPGEPLPENAFRTSYDRSAYRIWNQTMEAKQSWHFCTYLENRGVESGIATISYVDTDNKRWAPHAKTVVPVRDGLAYVDPVHGAGCDVVDEDIFLNLKPSDRYVWWNSGETITKIVLHWRLGEGRWATQTVR